MTLADYEYSEGWCEVRFDFSENTSATSRTYPSVFIFDPSGNQVQFVQEENSSQLGQTSWISSRRLTSEQGRTWMTDITYYDGLGWPGQRVSKWAAPDYGARMYDPTTARWLTQDPLSEQYYDISPYSFCAGNPLKYVDMDGMDIWEIDSEGYIRWREKSEGHRLYSMTSDGYRSQDYITVRDRAILDALSEGTDISSFSSRKNIDDIFNVFKFASDNSDVEWVVHRNDVSYTIGTQHDSNTSGSWGDYGLSKPQVSVHSHPDVQPDEELFSMGFVLESPTSARAIIDKDWYNARNDILQNSSSARMSYVYFPYSSNLYYVGYNRPMFIRKIQRDYKRFYFGVLNIR